MISRLRCLVVVPLVACAHAVALEAVVKDVNGSPMMHIDGKPVSPLMFYGWESGVPGPADVDLTTEWREYTLTVTASETTDGASGIHFRMGGEGPGSVWLDNVRVYPADSALEAMARGGDFEGAREAVERDWRLYAAAGADAGWTLDAEEKVSGAQSVRFDVKSSGNDHMHVHWIQSGYSVKAGQKYTVALWAKADKPRIVDFMMLHIGPPWTIYQDVAPKVTPYRDQVRLARDAGVDIVSFGIPTPWPQPGDEADFAGVDQAIETTLAENPRALLLPRFGMAPPKWWLDAHPDDRLLFDDGETVSMAVASEAWRAEMLERLRALVRHCEEKYGDSVIGYHPCGQHTGEWFYERSWEERYSDFSPAMNAGFRTWVRARYASVEALREAWGAQDIDFESVSVPSAEQQGKTTLGLFRDPSTERHVIDYFHYKQIAMEEPLELMARVIKEETKGKKLSCFFYGYLFDMHGIPFGAQNSGHLALKRLLECPDVDIVCSPISYLDRELGGAGMFMSPVDSVRAHGKLWLNEDDTRTYLTPPASGFGRVDTAQGSYWVHQRNFAQLWPRRLATWYMDLGGTGWLNAKDLWDNIGEMQSFYQQHINEPAQWSPEVALIVDEDSPHYTACTRQFSWPIVYDMRSQYFRMGAPFNIYLLSDLVDGKVPRAKVYFFANCFRLDARQREAVARETRGATVTWFYGGGFISDAARDENIGEITGLRVRRGAAESGKVQPAADQHGLAAGLTEPFGTDTILDPLWVVDEPDAAVLARYASGAPAAAAKQTAEGLRVYIGALHCPAKLLRNILDASGVHVYNDSDDVVLTDGKFISISATSAGAKSIALPKTGTVVEALTGAEVARDTNHIDFDLSLGETRMFILKQAE